MSVVKNKEIVSSAKRILAELGHEIPTGHLYEFFSKLSGEKSWNNANAKKLSFADVEVARQATDITPELAEGTRLFSVKISTESERKCVKYYRLNAQSEKAAAQIVQEYILVRTGELEEKDIKLAGTRLLLEVEDESDFNWQNWEVADSCIYAPDVEHAVEIEAEEARNILRSYQYRLAMSEKYSQAKKV
jgi:hypothetical protein